MRTHPSRLITLSLALAVAACGGGSSKKEPGPDPWIADCKAGTATLTGTFVTPNGEVPVVGAEITFSGAPGCVTSTSGDGTFELRNVPAAAGTVTAQKGKFHGSKPATPGTPVEVRIDPNSVAIAWVYGDYDTVQDVVGGLGFESTELAMGDVASADLSTYDLILLNCGLDEAYFEDVPTLEALRAWIEAGGAVYASDWAAIYVDALYPGKVNYLQPDWKVGGTGDQTATLVDAALARAVGKKTATISFDLSYWVVIDSLGSGVELLIRGPVSLVEGGGTLPDRPYAARFTAGKGRVTYTSFHEEGQSTADMVILLQQMVLGL